MAVLLPVLLFVLLVGSLIDIITRQEGQVKHLPKVVWILLVVFLPIVGSLIWFAIGREYREPEQRGGFGTPRRQEAPAPRPAEAYRPRPQPKSTEDQLAELEREIEFYKQQDRIRGSDAKSPKAKSIEAKDTEAKRDDRRERSE